MKSVKKADDSSVAVLDVIGEYHAPAFLPNVTEIRATDDVHIPIGFEGSLRLIRTVGDVYIPKDMEVQIISTGKIVLLDENDDR